MKSYLLTTFLLLSTCLLHSQTTETFDITTFQAPKGWKRTNGQGYVLFQDQKAGKDAGFCILVVYASRNSSGDADKDFQQEWNDLVVKPNGSVPHPKIEKEKTPEGWMAVTGVTSLTEKNVEYALMLVTASGFGKTTSILTKVAGEKYMPVIENFLSTMQLNTNTTGKSTSSTLLDKTFIGSWGKIYNPMVAYSNDMTVNMAFAGVKRGQYVFKEDGTYSFHGENWGGQVKYTDNANKMKLRNEKEYGLIDEIGNFSVNGNRVTIIPVKNIYRIVEADGKLLRTEKIDLEKREYTWQTYYAVGMEETRLVLTATSENFIDGDFSTYEPAVSFPKSFGYALNKSMFFKFLPMDLSPATTSTVSINDKLLGKWAKSASSPPQYQNGYLVNLVNAGYHKGQYDFKRDGTYSFHGESQFSSNDFGLTDEKGTYSVSGDRLIVTPSSSSVRKVDHNGNLKKSEQLPLTKRVYNWKLHHFDGIDETNLVLSAVAENMLDGGYGSNSLFPSSFLYSQKFIPEWRFKP